MNLLCLTRKETTRVTNAKLWLSLWLWACVAALANLSPPALAADYTEGVAVSGNTATIWFKSNVNTTWVDVHYQVNQGPQQNVRMVFSGTNARYEQPVTASQGNVLSYFFTYNNGLPAFDSPRASFTVGGGGGGGVTPVGNSSITSGANYKLVNPNSGRVLDVGGCATNNSANVQIWANDASACNGGAGQVWIPTLNSDGTYTLVNPNSGKALDVAGCGTANGSNVQIWANGVGVCNGGAGQKWKINTNTDGTFTLLNANSNNALDVAGCGTANGTNVQTWANGIGTCGGGAGQKWRFIAPTTPVDNGNAPPGYKLVWNDEFNGSGLPDPNKWVYDTERNQAGWYNNELQYYGAGRLENSSVGGGVLSITARREALTSAADYGGQAYTSARLITRGKAEWTYGFMEVRAKLPCGGGTWPAIWMLGTQGDWPARGEIDIMEQVGNQPNSILGTVHTTAGSGANANGNRTTLNDACTVFHNYQLTWTPQSLTIGIDGRNFHTYNNQGQGSVSWPFDKPQYLLLNLAIGGDLGGAVDNNIFPRSMQVDYVRVYQKDGSNTGGGGTVNTSDTPDFGPNVTIFDPSTPSATIQSRFDSAFNSQLKSPTAQFGDQRYVFLFKPGNYGRLFANLGFYTAVAGLGRNPDDVSIQADMNVDAGWNLGDEKNATQNFWRSVENMAITPSTGTNRWAVSQAAPFRRMHVRGNLTMGPSNQDFGQGYSSGGYIADSRVDGQISSGSQQQWYTRDSSIGSWTGGVWNMVFSGVVGAPSQGFPNTNKNTVLNVTPVSREKPYLYVDAAGKYRIFVPSLRINSAGASWPDTAGTSIPMSQFYVAKPSDSASTLNAALAQGLNLFFTPGVYHLNQTINVTRANTVVTGIGFPTLIPDGGVNAMSVADVDGVKISNLLFDAGTVNSPVLLTVGNAGSHINHSANPISVQDVFFRIGGAVAGKSTTSLIINSDHTLIDHIWAWRADHGNSPTGWNINTADTGVIVNGNDVLATGLFVEHYQKYNVIWNGNGGKTIFFQNEMPYDPPSQAIWRAGANGYAGYKVADSVTTHEGWGLGSYCVFFSDPSIRADRGFEVPNTPGVRLHSISTVSLGGVGYIDHVVNNTGAVAQGVATIPVTLVNYP